MPRRFVFALACALVACEPAPPDTPEAREAVAVCAAEAPAEVVAKGIPDARFEAALAAAGKVAVSSDMAIATSGYRGRDLSERAAAIRAAAEAVGVKTCPLADALAATATAAPGPEDLKGVVEVLQALSSVLPEYVTPVAAAGCAELPACARECVPGLAAMSLVEPQQRALALAGGCAAFRPHVGGGAAAVEAFVRARMTAFIDACLPKLAGSAKTEVEALRRQLGF